MSKSKQHHFVPAAHIARWGPIKLKKVRETEVWRLLKNNNNKDKVKAETICKKNKLYESFEETLMCPLDSKFINIINSNKNINIGNKNITDYIRVMSIRHPRQKTKINNTIQIDLKILKLYYEMLIFHISGLPFISHYANLINNEIKKLSFNDQNEINKILNNIKSKFDINKNYALRLLEVLVGNINTNNIFKRIMFNHNNEFDKLLLNRKLEVCNVSKNLVLGDSPLISIYHHNNKFVGDCYLNEPNKCSHWIMPIDPNRYLHIYKENCNIKPNRNIINKIECRTSERFIIFKP